jgi:hypothetical protein
MLGVNGENIARRLIRARFVPGTFQTLTEQAERVALRDIAFVSAGPPSGVLRAEAMPTR